MAVGAMATYMIDSSEVSHRLATKLIDNTAAAEALSRLQILYAPILLALFIALFIGYGIVTAGTDEALEKAKTKLTGPGGKPLPVRVTKKQKGPDVAYTPTQRLLFIWLSLGMIVGFLGSAANVLVHALYLRKEGWWCGESAVVRMMLFYSLYRI